MKKVIFFDRVEFISNKKMGQYLKINYNNLKLQVNKGWKESLIDVGNYLLNFCLYY